MDACQHNKEIATGALETDQMEADSQVTPANQHSGGTGFLFIMSPETAMRFLNLAGTPSGLRKRLNVSANICERSRLDLAVNMIMTALISFIRPMENPRSNNFGGNIGIILSYRFL